MNGIHGMAAQGAERILRECLLLEPSDVLALFWDESTVAPASLIRQAAHKIDVRIRGRSVSIQEQSGFDPRCGLAARDRDVLDSARSVLACISNSPTSTGYRSALINAGTTGGVRFGHMPGVDLHVLASAVDVDYDEADRRCDDLSLALALGERGEIETYEHDAAGQVRPHRLTVDLGGLARPPISSTGRIPLGTWGNIPGGEAFIAPLEGSAEGAFVLNGAFTDHILQPPSRLILHFKEGRLVGVDGPDDVTAEFERLLEPGRRQADPSVDCLAELGIGVNSGLIELTGNALFDEKCSGTAHIAVGDSVRYGGQQHSIVHEDLVTRHPSLWIDGKQVLDHGRDVFAPAQWRDRLTTTVISPLAAAEEFLLRRSGVRADHTGTGLKVRREVAAGRICCYHLGDHETSPLLVKVYELVPPLPTNMLFSQLKRDAALRDISEDCVRKSLTILMRHHMIDVLAGDR